MTASLAEQLYRAYEKSLADALAAPPNASILCPLCLRPRISLEGVRDKTVPLEHILPQSTSKRSQLPERIRRMGFVSNRSGLTLTCPDCNSRKGRTVDAIFMRARKHGEPTSFGNPFRTAILTYGYLLAFAIHGYPYILRAQLDSIRAQFLAPDDLVSPWLEQVHLDAPWHDSLVLNSWGYPGFMASTPGELIVAFWSYAAPLPPWLGLNPVELPEAILAQADAPT